jgi:hypothetical protein
MPKLVVLITPQLEAGRQIGETWQQSGAPGVTFLESYGLRRLQEEAESAEVLPGLMSMMEILRSRDRHSMMLLSVVPDARLIDQMIADAQGLLGNLNSPNNGILFVLDVERAVGVRGA